MFSAAFRLLNLNRTKMRLLGGYVRFLPLKTADNITVALVAVDSVANYVVVDCNQFGLKCWREWNHRSKPYDLFWIVDF